MKLTWLKKKIIKQAAGTERGENVIAFLESEAAYAAYALFKGNLLPAIIALLKRDWKGFYAALPDEWQQEVKGVKFITASATSRSVGFVNRLDGKGFVPASTPEERAAANEQIAASNLRRVSDVLAT